MKPATLSELLTLYCEHLIEVAPETRQKYEIVLRHYQRVNRTDSVDSLSNESVSRMMATLLDEGCENVTVNGYRSKIVALWTWACKQGWISKWPSVRILTTPRKAPVAWSPEEIRRLWAALGETKGTICQIPAPLWWRAYLAVALDTGERHSARLALRWEHFTDFANGIGKFPYEVCKGKRADMPFQLDAFTVGLLREIGALDVSPFVLPWAQTRGTFFVRYKAILESAGLPTDRAHMTHCLRKFVATQLRVAGVDATAALGHADQKTTDERYIDARFIPRRAICNVVPRPWS